MIVVQLAGGLGNQLFQYALGRCLAEKLCLPLKMDTSFLDNSPKDVTKRVYALGDFQIKEVFASSKEINYFFNQPKNYLQRIKRKINQRLNPFYLIKEKQFNFDESIFHLKGHLYLQGYWQSEKNFTPIEQILRKEIVLKEEARLKQNNYFEAISKENIVSVHIRRTDYVHNPKANQYHGILTIDYYMKAIELITSKVGESYFYIFSDDLNWCKDNFKIRYETVFVEENNPSVSMMLMSQCKHHIIANSSFSWWGAWLSHNSNKIVVAPKRWFRDVSINTQDLMPHHWLMIDNE